jgi:uncharacterized hydrophobic protein (TIGR00271 family)
VLFVNDIHFMKRKLLRIIIHIKNFIGIREGSDTESTVNSITSGVYLRGGNFWYLICSSILASIGLDVNSPAIIIGAMLISPLMGPILGVGLGFGIYNRELLLDSIKQFSLAVIISLLISALYFLLTPLGNPTSEILARTEPTLLDVGVAIFGGLAGIIAGSRKGIATAIPGVAIATALMPPICTAGFGLSTSDPKIFFGAFYLFFINSMFISISVFLVVRYLKFPYKEYLDPKKKTRMRKWVAIIVIVLTIPSLIIFYTIIKETKETNNIKRFLKDNIQTENRDVVNWRIYELNGQKELKIYVFGERISETKQDSLKNLLGNYSINDSKLSFVQVDVKKGVEQYGKKLENNIDSRLQVIMQQTNDMQKRLDEVESAAKEKKTDSINIVILNKELVMLYDNFESLSFSKILDKKNDTDTIFVYKPYVKINWNNKNKNNTIAENKIIELIKARLQLDTLLILK